MAIRKNLVLGGSGTIGKALCIHLELLGEEVINLDLKNGKDIRIIDLDFFKNIDFVWFLAWDVGGAKYLYNPSNQLQIIKNNTLICEKVFSYLEKYKLPFIFASSQLASFDNAYGVTKKLGENWTKFLGGSIVRFWNVYGWEEPGEKSHIIPDLIIKSLLKQHVKLLTDGEEERQFIYIVDTVKNLIRMREMGLKEADMTNNEWVKIKYLASLITQKLGNTFELGSTQGYNIRFEANPSSKNFMFETNLEMGITEIISRARQFLKM